MKKRTFRNLLLIILFAAAAFGGSFDCDYHNGPTTMTVGN
jgi:hypothetical protein